MSAMSLAEDSFSQALAAVEAGELERAESAFRRVIGEKPDHLQGLRGLAEVLRRQNRGEEAEALEGEARMIESADLAKVGAQLIKLGQHASAQRPIDRALQLDPGNAAALVLAGGLARTTGDFELAAELYARAQVVDPENADVATAVQVLTGRPLEARLEEEMPVIVPFARLAGFLDKEAHGRVMAFAQANLASFQQSHVLRGMDQAYDTSVRSSRVAMEPKEIAGWFKPRVISELPQVFARLGYAPFEVAKIELQMTAHLDGDFYTMHNDNSHGHRQGHDSDGRRISFVYYFCREPKRFTGGELRLFDTDLKRGASSKELFSRVAPHDNSIVFFPSAAMHEVGRLDMESSDPADGRFTLNGWIHPAN
jgi:Rps23 Pro-64 3,4-dihydroxylase Tpa1-like proline 4-hydroxylase/thioredoxin-like negative regulator of GroEL